ncbi:MAG: radical SAM protein [Anaerofustis sp.]
MTAPLKLFNDTLTKTLIQNKRFLLQRPSYAKKFIDIATKMKKQADIRSCLLETEDITVPPILIISITNDCNLSCKGCYACAQNREKTDEMTIDEIERIIDESIELGVSIVMIAGGEPLMKEGILAIPKKHPDTVFVLFTNGLLLDSNATAEIDKMKNVFPIISLEGDQDRTDSRRGIGVYENTLQIMRTLNRNKMLFGTSITLTVNNFEEILHGDYLKQLQEIGNRAAFLIEYVPSDGNFDICLTEDQKTELRRMEDALTEQYDMLIILLPGDEERYGGCMAAGRGFIHVSSTGALEACPFAPFSDLNLKEISFKEALKSPMMREIRDNHHLLKESRGGCALIENKEWIAGLTE